MALAVAFVWLLIAGCALLLTGWLIGQVHAWFFTKTWLPQDNLWRRSAGQVSQDWDSRE